MSQILIGTRRKVSIATQNLGIPAVAGFRSAILQTEGLLDDIEEVEVPGILGDMPFDTNVIAGPENINGAIGENTLYSEGAFPLALLHAMGSVSGAQQGGTDAYKWDFSFIHRTIYGDSKTMTVLIDRDSANAQQFADCVVNSITIKWSHGQVVSWTANLYGISYSAGSSPTVTKPTINPLVDAGAVVTIAGLAVPVVEGEITITNNFDPGFWNGNSRVRFPRNGFAEVIGKFTKPVIETDDEAAYFEKFRAKTKSTLDISITGAQISGVYYHKLNIACGAIVYKDLAGFASGGKENAKLPIGFKALGSTAGTMAVSAYIINTENSLA